MNEGQVDADQHPHHGKNLDKAQQVAEAIQARSRRRSTGVVDARIIQRLDYPEYIIDVDRAKAADLGLNQRDVMENVVAAFNSSIQFNKKNFWIDPVSTTSISSACNIPKKTSSRSTRCSTCRSPARCRTSRSRCATSPLCAAPTCPTEVTHTNLQPTIDLTMGVSGRDLGHVADDVTRVVARFGKPEARRVESLTIPLQSTKKPLEGSKLELTGEYSRMQDTFQTWGLD